MSKPFHLGWFLMGSNAYGWELPWSGNIGEAWSQPELRIDITRSLERGGFDFILIEDSTEVPDAYGASMQIYMDHAMITPRQDPVVVAALLAQATSKIGIIPTVATFSVNPYMLARSLASLDQLSGGRIGWNVVTGVSDRAAQNQGLNDMPPHDVRYDMADEFMEVVNGLWGSWEPGSILADPQTGRFADHAKVHPINHVGRHYKVRGPLNTGPLPQGKPVIAQAGGSPRGRRFAARHGDLVVCEISDVDGMKAYRDDIRRHASDHGRDPDRVKVLFLACPLIGASQADVAAKLEERKVMWSARSAINIAFLAQWTNIDFSTFDPDMMVDDLDVATNGLQGSLAEFKKKAKGLTLRQAGASMMPPAGSIDLVGTPQQVAGQMKDIMEAVGGDGFLFESDMVNRRTMAEVVDGLIPELQRQGLSRKVFEHQHFRDNLMAF